jgi:hypothetical protein
LPGAAGVEGVLGEEGVEGFEPPQLWLEEWPHECSQQPPKKELNKLNKQNITTSWDMDYMNQNIF